VLLSALGPRPLRFSTKICVALARIHNVSPIAIHKRRLK
jgi:hypothetical protein